MYFSSSTGPTELLGSRLSSSATVPMTLAERNADQVIYREDPSISQMSGSTSQVYVQVAPNTHTEETRQGPAGQLITHTETRETLNPLITPAQCTAPAVVREEKLPATVSTRAYEVFRKDPSTVFPNSKIIAVNQPGPVTTPSGSVYDPATNTITSAFNGQVTQVQPALHIGSTLQRYPDMPTAGLQPVISQAVGYSMSSMNGITAAPNTVTFAPGLTSTSGPTSGYLASVSSSGYPQQIQQVQQFPQMNNSLGYAQYGQPSYYTGDFQQSFRPTMTYTNDMPLSYGVYEPQSSTNFSHPGMYTVQNRGGVTTQHYESGPITTTSTWGGENGQDGGYTTTTYSEEQTRKTFSTPHTQTIKTTTTTSGVAPTPMTQYNATPVTQYNRQPSVQN